MKRKPTIILVLLVLAIVQLACSMPQPQSQPVFETPVFVTPTGGPMVITATSGAPTPAVATATQAPTATTAASTGNNNIPPTGACTYLATFVADVTIPDDSRIAPGTSFVKTWRVRNDGTCTWGPNQPLNALAFTGGSQLNGPEKVALPGSVAPGQSIDLSVNLVAPVSAGVYTSEWKLRVDGVSGVGPNLGLGARKVDPLFTRIVVGATPTPTPSVTPTTAVNQPTRIEFASGATGTSVEGSVKAGATRSYVLSAGKDQLLMAGFSSATSDLRMRVVQVSTGSVLVSGSGTSGQTYLPASGDYLIEMIGGSTDAKFTLGVTIPSLLTFASGSTATSVDGKIFGRQPVFYLLRAQAGQTMTVKISSPSNTVTMTIYGVEDGQPLVRADFGLSEWSGNINVTQNYVIMAVPSTESTSFTMMVTVK